MSDDESDQRARERDPESAARAVHKGVYESLELLLLYSADFLEVFLRAGMQWNLDV